ncbi:MAG: tRNA lysidine(34) synthetase TilS [Flavobacteriaceae bacterium]
MIKQFQAHIAESFPDPSKTKFLVACSGGVDSVVLSHLCSRSGYNFALAHCNFQLRGEESDQDAHFVEDLAKQLDVPFHLKHFDTRKYVEETKQSVQIAARALRYSWFEELIESEPYTRVLTAHHADDALETFIINLSRSTGLAGLTGIPAQTELVYRPLLIFSRNDIEAFARDEKLQWREDSSNRESVYLRNKIRHELVPVLKELHPTFLQNFKKTQSNLQAMKAILKVELEQIRKELFRETDGYLSITIESLRKLQPLEAYLYALLSDYGFTDWDSIADLLNAPSGKQISSSSHRLVKDRDDLLLSRCETIDDQTYFINPQAGEVIKPVSMIIDEVPSIGSLSDKILYVDKETLNHRLAIRKWRKGDYFYPLGLGGKKLVSKYFKDQKMNALEKERQWLLFSGDRLLWVIGRRADERFKVGQKTKEIIRIKLLG